MLLLLLTGLGLGLMAERKLQRRALSWTLLAQLAEQLGERIRCTSAPLAVVWQELAMCSELRRLPLLRGAVATDDVRHALREAVAASADEMALNADDTCLLTEFVDGCGAADIAGEVLRCRQYAVQFRERSAEARAEAAHRGRLYITLGFCGGSMAALLLGG